MTLFKAPVAILSVAALLAVSVPAYAQTPPDLRDLVGEGLRPRQRGVGGFRG